MRIEVGECERVNDGFFQFFDDVFKSSNIVELDGDVFWRYDFHCNVLFVCGKVKILQSGALAAVGVVIVVSFGVVPRFFGREEAFEFSPRSLSCSFLLFSFLRVWIREP